MEMDYGSRNFTLATWHSAANYHSAVDLLALADMPQPDSQRGETVARRPRAALSRLRVLITAWTAASAAALAASEAALNAIFCI